MLKFIGESWRDFARHLMQTTKNGHHRDTRKKIETFGQVIKKKLLKPERG